jgi:hypothetical protein
VQEHNRRLKEVGLQIMVIEDANHPAYPGKRVIATRRIPAHTVIGEYTGEVLNETQKLARYPDGCKEMKEGGYVFDNGKGLYIDAFDPRLSNVTRYVNGACASYPANTTALQEGGKVHIRTHARAIEKGGELWLNYGPAYTFAARAQETTTTGGRSPGGRRRRNWKGRRRRRRKTEGGRRERHTHGCERGGSRGPPHNHNHHQHQHQQPHNPSQPMAEAKATAGREEEAQGEAKGKAHGEAKAKAEAKED